MHRSFFHIKRSNMRISSSPIRVLKPACLLAFLLAGLSPTAQDQTTVNEVVLPIVVNGAIAEKLHYQTIFTVLNGSKQVLQATLQVYDNSGTPGGVFCSPLAPPPSRVTMTLQPDAQYFQFTSADLPYLNGWALVRWEGPASLLVSTEVTLANAAPFPCLLICNRPSTEKLSSAQISAVRPATEFRLPVTLNRYRQTALAIVNPSATRTLRIKVTLLDAAGDIPKLGVPASFEEKVEPLARTSKFLWQMAQEHSPLDVIVPVPDMFQGSLILSAEIPFAVGALNIMFPEGKFVTIPILSPPQ